MNESEDVDPSASQLNQVNSKTDQAKLDDFVGLIADMKSGDKNKRDLAYVQYEQMSCDEMAEKRWLHYKSERATAKQRARSFLELRRVLGMGGKQTLLTWGTERMTQFKNELITIFDTNPPCIIKVPADGTPRGTAGFLLRLLLNWDFIPDDEVPSIFMKLLKTTEPNCGLNEWTAVDEIDDKQWTVELGKGSLESVGTRYEILSPILQPLSSKYLQDDNWARRNDAVIMLFVLLRRAQNRGVTEGENSLVEIVAKFVHLLNDNDPRVRNCICQTLKRMSKEYSPDIQNGCHHMIIPALISILSDPVPRVAAHAAAAIDEFMHHWESGETNPNIAIHQGSIMAGLERVLQAKCQVLLFQKKTLVLAKLISCISNSTNDQLFLEYYGRLSGPLKFLIREGYDCYKLVGESIECMSLMGEVVKRDRFAKDGIEMVRSLVSVSVNGNTVFYRMLHRKEFATHLLRVARVIGIDFAQLLPSLMPIIIDHAEKSYGRDSGVCTCKLSDDEKRASIRLILGFSSEFVDQLAPYIDSIRKLAQHHRSRIPYSIDCRWAYTIFPYLINCLKMKGDIAAIRPIWMEYSNALLEAIKAVDDTLHASLLFAFTKGIEQVGSEVLTGDGLMGVGEMMRNELEGVMKRASDEKTRQEIVMSKILVGISEILHAAYKETGLSLMTGDDLLMLINLLLPLISHDIPVIRRNCAYGIGVLASCRVPQLIPLATHALDGLCSVITRGDARSTEKAIPATENALTAIARILGSYGGTIGEEKYNQVFSIFIDSLSLHAITNDKGESEHIYGFIVDLYQKNRGFIPDQHVKFLRSFILSIHFDSFKSTPPSLLVKSRVCAVIKQTKESGESSFKAVVDQTGFTVSEMETLNKILS